MRIADINGDGKQDIGYAGSDNYARILLGNGNGTFQAELSIHVGHTTDSLAFGDVNADGKLDLITVDAINGGYIKLGNGMGHFKQLDLWEP